MQWRCPVPGTPALSRLLRAWSLCTPPCKGAAWPGPEQRRARRCRVQTSLRGLRKNYPNSHAEHELSAFLRGPAEVMEEMCTEDSMCSHREFQRAPERKLRKPRWAEGHKPLSLGHPIASAPGGIGVCCHSHNRRGDKDHRHRYPESL
ncbi:unnamed protein product [Coccothraustes coccothraustes]